MKIIPANVTLLGEALDHPECVCLDQQGNLVTGSEAGKVVRVEQDGSQHEVGNTGGFLLGLALDGNDRVHACDCGKNQVFRIDPDGTVTLRSSGTPDRPFTVPNFPVFDREGNLYVSDSGDYWNPQGTGAVLKIDPQDNTTVFHSGPFQFANGLAIDPTEQWLYVVQSTAPNIVRIPLNESNGPIEITHRLPLGTVPDGIACTADGRVVIGCYKPDGVFLGDLDGNVEVLCEDPTGELLSRPTNVALGDGKLFIANLGGWHITCIATDLTPGPIFRPHL